MDLAELENQIKQAAAIAQSVPDNLQEAAFHRALDLLAGTAQRSQPAAHGHSADPATRTPGATPPKHPPPEQDLAKLLTKDMNATEHPKVRSAGTVLERALAVLHGARVSHQIDGMTPSEIAKVLTEKFRISTKSGSVSDALGKVSGELVDRVTEGGGYRYRIMEAGERRLERIGGGAGASPHAQPVRPNRRGSKKPAAASNTNENEATKAPAKRKSTGRPGPKRVVSQLIDEGFFKDAKTIGDIISHLEKARGRSYKMTDLSPALVRLLRDERLERDKNIDGQYEYVAR
jgi:hypothetical protein